MPKFIEGVGLVLCGQIQSNGGGKKQVAQLKKNPFNCSTKKKLMESNILALIIVLHFIHYFQDVEPHIAYFFQMLSFRVLKSISACFQSFPS
jgi:hypothetical protein